MAILTNIEILLKGKLPITGLKVEEIDKIQKELYSLSNQVSFDDRINHKAQIEDLKLPLIQNYLYKIKSKLYEESKNMDFVELCQSMRIVEGTPEYLKPVNVGLLFFNDMPQDFFPYSQIEIVDLRGGLEGDNMTENILILL